MFLGQGKLDFTERLVRNFRQIEVSVITYAISNLTFPHLPTSVGAERDMCIIRIQFHITRSSQHIHSHIQSVGWQASQRGHVHDRRSHRPTAEVKGLRRCAPEAKGCSDHRAIHEDILLGKWNAFLDANILPNLHNLVITLHTLYPVKPFLLRAILSQSQNYTGSTCSSRSLLAERHTKKISKKSIECSCELWPSPGMKANISCRSMVCRLPVFPYFIKKNRLNLYSTPPVLKLYTVS